MTRCAATAGRAADRDAAVVGHEFTPMRCCSERASVVVVAGDGHDLIDVDRRRDLDAVSSWCVDTLGHHVAERYDAACEQLDRGAHSTMPASGNHVIGAELVRAETGPSRSARRAHMGVVPKRRPGDRPGGTEPASPGSPLEPPYPH
jgi:glutamate-1-semialdehyde aminotransferase